MKLEPSHLYLLFTARGIGAYGRLIYCAVLSKAVAEGQLSVTMRSKELAEITALSPQSVKRHIRELARAKLLDIEDLSHAGYHITLFDVSDLISTLPTQKDNKGPVDIDSLDFFSGRKFIESLLTRQRSRCL